jgi:hypothetical protein
MHVSNPRLRVVMDVGMMDGVQHDFQTLNECFFFVN